MTTITLPPRCDRAAAEALLSEFVSALGAGDLSIDGSKAVQVGQAMLQLLASARFSFASLRITPSDDLRDAAKLAGLEQILFDTLPIAPPAKAAAA